MYSQIVNNVDLVAYFFFKLLLLFHRLDEVISTPQHIVYTDCDQLFINATCV